MKTSLWELQNNHENGAKYPELTHFLEVDVAIVGSGITGLTTALQLLASNKKVAIIESDRVGYGTTGHSTGNLYIPVQPYFQTIVEKFNKKIAASVVQSRLEALEFIEATIRNLNINCHFSKRNWYLYTNDKDQIDFLDKEVAVLKNLNLAINYINTLPYSIPMLKAAVLPNQARFNPLQYVQALAAYLVEKGCLLFENTHITGEENNSDEHILITKKAKIYAKQVVMATHTPVGIHKVQMFTAPYRSYVVAAKLTDDVYPEMQLWDLHKPHHVICTHSYDSEKPNVLLVSGSHHKTGQSEDANLHFQELEDFTRSYFKVAKIIKKWSAQHYHAADSLPYIGSIDKLNTYYIATGFFADGLIYGTVAGKLIADLLNGNHNPYKKIYDPKRFTPIASAKNALKENLNVMREYLKDLPLTDHVEIKNIKNGDGKIVEINREKCGVYRDENNHLHIVSAVCPHMKCIVNWNNAEKTWDCPCHGSRFTIQGDVIEGPAGSKLKTKHLR